MHSQEVSASQAHQCEGISQGPGIFLQIQGPLNKDILNVYRQRSYRIPLILSLKPIIPATNSQFSWLCCVSTLTFGRVSCTLSDLQCNNNAKQYEKVKYVVHTLDCEKHICRHQKVMDNAP